MDFYLAVKSLKNGISTTPAKWLRGSFIKRIPLPLDAAKLLIDVFLVNRVILLA